MRRRQKFAELSRQKELERKAEDNPGFCRLCGQVFKPSGLKRHMRYCNG